jgi:CRISPR-associated protein Cas5d
MTFGVKLRARGEYACFTRPELKVERVSYDVLTPSAARGILEAIHWKPAIRWVVDRIHVLAPIHFESIRRNEVGSRIPAANIRKAMRAGSVDELYMVADDRNQRVQRSATVLRDVDYIIEAHFDLTRHAGERDSPAKHHDMFTRRARRGQCFHQPSLGCREFATDFTLLEGDPPPNRLPDDQQDRDLGWMLLDIAHTSDSPGHAGHRCGAGCQPLFFPARLMGGVLHVPPLSAPEVRS